MLSKKYAVKMVCNDSVKIVRRYHSSAQAVEAAHAIVAGTGALAWAGIAPVQSYRARLALVLGQRQRQRAPQFWPSN